MDTLDILLKSENASIRYRVLTELMGCDVGSMEVVKQKKALLESKEVKKIFSKMHPDGYWLQRNPRTKKVVGDNVEYGAYATTHYMLSYLMELGLTKEHSLVGKACERYLNLQKEDGDWWLYMSCLSGLNIRTFVKLGYSEDSRIKKSIELMLNTKRNDKGYLCEMHEKKSKKKKSCYRGSLKMLLAFSELPHLWGNPRCLELIDYFISRNGILDSKKVRFVNKDVESVSFPIGWQANNWELLYAFSKMGYGQEFFLKDSWELMKECEDKDGFINLNETPSQVPVNFGIKNKPCEWVTFYYLLAKKYFKVNQK